MRPWFDSWVGKIPWRRDRLPTPVFLGFHGGSDGEESICNVRDLGSVPRLGRSLGEGHDNPLQNSFMENSQGQKSLAGYSPWGSKDSDMTEWLSTAQHLYQGLPRWLSESICQCRRFGLHPWVGKIPWRRKCQPIPIFSPGKSLGHRSLVGYSPWGQKESDMTEDAHTHNLLPEDNGRNLTFHPRQCPSYNRPRQSRKELADLRHHLLDGQGAEAWWSWARHFVIFSLYWEHCYLAFEKCT